MPRSSPFSRLCAPALAFLLVAALTFGVSGERAPLAFAKGNASAAAGFLEDAQNDDGGFGAKKGKGSDPEASLWVAAALLSGGKHPLDEFNKGGDSLDAYLRNHKGSYTTVGQLGVLALVQGAAGYGASHYGDPASKLKNKLTEPAVRASPGGSALATLGLLAVGDETTAKSVAQVLLSSAREDGGWGSSDSESTALVLQAVAKAGVADKSSEVVQKGLAYLHRAQANDGAVMKSIRTDPGSAGGEVTATAFALQALDALGVSSPTTAEGKTFRDGLTQYQQQTTGGLSSNGSLYDSTFAPSVTETAQAYAAFNGTTFPLEPVAATTSGPPKKTKKKDGTEAASTKKKSKKVSTGSGATGISDTTADNKQDHGAFQRATVGRQGTAKKGAQDRKGAKRSGAKKAKTPAAGSGGQAVSGEVVGATSAPKLATRAGQDPGGLSDQDKATIGLGALLVVAIAIGGWLARRRPRIDERPRAQVALTAISVFVTRARARGALAPFATAVVGLALIAVPFATSMWDRAPKGAAMITAFAPHMRPAKVAAYQRDLAQLNDGITQASTKGAAVLYPGLKPAAARKRFAKDGPMLASFQATWPRTYRSLSSVVTPIAANQRGYEALTALPRFGLFPWFFVIPGALLVLLGAIALAFPGAWRFARWGVLAVGVGLIAAPAIFQLWDRAPKGSALVTAFKPIERRSAVVRVQNDFGQVAIAQGALAGELVPALRQHGLSQEQINQQFPAVQTLLARWIPILNDLTPVIGVMSDNVGRFQAVAALPPFTAFPWLFVLPGLLVSLIVLIGLAQGVRRQQSMSIPEHLERPSSLEGAPHDPFPYHQTTGRPADLRDRFARRLRRRVRAGGEEGRAEGHAGHQPGQVRAQGAAEEDQAEVHRVVLPDDPAGRDRQVLPEQRLTRQ
ncbi:hypothetical protein [Baekduia sp.]|jgi:hypothetical protein|uniref:hypothetical protein n=1 Tax=Baekduia sp. TaxID=2600305 RepID=UPI002E019B51|nr:hypothetical protein [Baekduia sp.]